MSNVQTIPIEPRQLARRARLRYVADSDEGYTRHTNGHGFVYVNSRGKRVGGSRELARIDKLAIPPAWKDVWICRLANGHLQATGRDDRRRKQYIYHERWRLAADNVKFRRLIDFGRELPKLRRSVARNLRTKGLTRSRVVAGIVALLDLTSIRVGSEEYVRENNSYGLTTLRTRHVVIKAGRAFLKFRGKGGILRDVEIVDKRLVRLLRQLTKLRGAHVFQYQAEDGSVRIATAADVNDFLREVTGSPFTAKDFRTWKASAFAAGELLAAGEAQEERARKKTLKKIVGAVAEILGNTPTVCRKYYIHAALLECYLAGTAIGRRQASMRRTSAADEKLLGRFLRKWFKSHRSLAA